MPGFNVPLNTRPKVRFRSPGIDKHAPILTNQDNVLGSYVPGFTMALDSQVLDVCDLGYLNFIHFNGTNGSGKLCLTNNPPVTSPHIGSS